MIRRLLCKNCFLIENPYMTKQQLERGICEHRIPIWIGFNCYRCGKKAGVIG